MKPQPTQTPGLYAAKDWFSRVLNPVVRVAVRFKLSADLFTFVGMAGAVLAAWGIVILDPALTLLGLVIRLAGANLDGSVARARDLKNPLGFFANELGDRISDFTVMLAFVLVAMFTLNEWAVNLTLLAAVTASFPTVVSLLGYRAQKRAGLSQPARINGGPFGKTERCAAAFLAVLGYRVAVPFSDAALVVTLWVFASLVILGSLLTAWMRAKQIFAILRSAAAIGEDAR